METINEAVTGAVAPADERARKQAAWDQNMVEMEREWAAQRQRQDEVTTLNKAALFAALAASGIVTVTVTFDGCGDSGQIEDVSAHSSESQQIDLPTATIDYRQIGYDGAGPSVTQATVRTVVDDLVYLLLDQTHGGWGDGDGAYGEFSFDVPSCSIKLEYNERYTASTYSEHEF